MGTLTTASFAELSGLAGNVGSKTAFTYLAVGTGTTAESAAHTALVSEITDSGLARAAGTVSQVTTTQTNDTLQITKTWTVTGTKTIAEAATLNAAAAGTMLERTKLGTARSVSSGDSYTYTSKTKFA